MQDKIPINKPFVAGTEMQYISRAVAFGKTSSDGPFTQQCSRFLEDRFGIGKAFMTPSCTAALELAAMLCDVGSGDEVIMPSYTFVSTANAVVRLGAKPVFVDIRPDTLNLNENLIENAITSQTKAIFPVHYAGVACEMERILDIADCHDLAIVEDAAQGVNAFYGMKALGSMGHLGTYSFHETKHLHCGEGGALCVNEPAFVERAEILREKGTNRAKFFRGEVDKYTWVDIGSSYVPSEISSAFLLAQLEHGDEITKRRRAICDFYRELLARLEERGLLRLPQIPVPCEGNGHLFYILLQDEPTRDAVVAYLKHRNIQVVFHYVPLHTSPMGRKLGYREGDLPVTEDVARRLLRLPVFNDITEQDQLRVVCGIEDFFQDAAKSLGRVQAAPPKKVSIKR